MKRNRNFIVAVTQCASLAGQVGSNLRKVTELCAEARKRHADLLLFPECHATGYSYRALPALVEKTAEPMDGPIGRHLRMAARDFSMVICCGMFERDDGAFYNTLLVAFPDGRLERQRKGSPSPAEIGLLNFDPIRLAFRWKDTTFGILVCADNRIPDFREQFEKLGIELLLHPSAGSIAEPGPQGAANLKAESEAALNCGRALARDLRLSYAVANPIGFSGEDYYPGNSWVIDPLGAVLVHLPPTSIVAEMKDSVGAAALA